MRKSSSSSFGSVVEESNQGIPKSISDVPADTSNTKSVDLPSCFGQLSPDVQKKQASMMRSNANIIVESPGQEKVGQELSIDERQQSTLFLNKTHQKTFSDEKVSKDEQSSSSWKSDRKDRNLPKIDETISDIEPIPKYGERKEKNVNYGRENQKRSRGFVEDDNRPKGLFATRMEERMNSNFSGRGRGRGNYRGDEHNEGFRQNRGYENGGEGRGRGDFRGKGRGGQGRGQFGVNYEKKDFNREKRLFRNFQEQREQCFKQQKMQKKYSEIQQKNQEQSNQIKVTEIKKEKSKEKREQRIEDINQYFQPIGQKCWPQTSLYVLKVKIFFTLRSITSYKADLLVIPFPDKSFKIYPGNIINKCPINYKKKLEEKGFFEFQKEGSVYFQKCIGIPQFKGFVFINVGKSAGFLMQGLEEMFNSLESLNQKLSPKNILFPYSQSLGSLEPILNKMITSIEKVRRNTFLSEVAILTKEPEDFYREVPSYVNIIRQLAEENQLCIDF